MREREIVKKKGREAQRVILSNLCVNSMPNDAEIVFCGLIRTYFGGD